MISILPKKSVIVLTLITKKRFLHIRNNFFEILVSLRSRYVFVAKIENNSETTHFTVSITVTLESKHFQKSGDGTML